MDAVGDPISDDVHNLLGTLRTPRLDVLQGLGERTSRIGATPGPPCTFDCCGSFVRSGERASCQPAEAIAEDGGRNPGAHTEGCCHLCSCLDTVRPPTGSHGAGAVSHNGDV